MAARPYTGRFAPTPSGPLHFGSIVAALASWLDARASGGRWLVRIEDLDTPRIRAGSDTAILQALECLGLHWDGAVEYQSRRLDAYAAALERLRARGVLFPCICPRRVVKTGPYPGTCRGRAVLEAGASLRLRVPDCTITLSDPVQGERVQRLLHDTGDFIVRRSDGLFAYNLAVVIDDAWQGVTHVVRGADLLHTTHAQIHLQQLLELPHPLYCHVPVAVDSAGRKISKRLMAEDALLRSAPAELLFRALRFLGQDPEPRLQTAGTGDLLASAVKTWSPRCVPARQELMVSEEAAGDRV